MSRCDVELFENQIKLDTGQFRNTFILVHDDQFGRVETLAEIMARLDKDYEDDFNQGCSYEIEVISTVKRYDEAEAVNVFVLHIIHREPIEYFERYGGSSHPDVSDHFYQLNNLVDIQYYDCTAIHWNPVVKKDDKQIK